MNNSTIIIIIGSIIVAVIFITWLVRYISGLKKTRDFYQKKVSEMKNGKIPRKIEDNESIAADSAEKQSEDE